MSTSCHTGHTPSLFPELGSRGTSIRTTLNLTSHDSMNSPVQPLSPFLPFPFRHLVIPSTRLGNRSSKPLQRRYARGLHCLFKQSFLWTIPKVPSATSAPLALCQPSVTSTPLSHFAHFHRFLLVLPLMGISRTEYPGRYTAALSKVEGKREALRKRLERARKYLMLVALMGTWALNCAPEVAVTRVYKELCAAEAVHPDGRR